MKRNGWAILLGVGLLLALAGCGEKKPTAGGTTTSMADATAAELERFQAEENARSRVTMVDAATADAAAMPGDWSGPTAFDLAPKEAENKPATAGATKPHESTELAHAAEQAPSEEFPSVAE